MARSIVMGLEDHKWYQNEARIVAALRDAYDAGERRAAFNASVPITYDDLLPTTMAALERMDRGGTVTEVGQG